MTRQPQPIIDAHCDILLDAAEYGFSLAEDLSPGAYPGPCTGLYSLPKWERAGITVAFCAIFTAPFDLDMRPTHPEHWNVTLHRALRMVAALHRDLRLHASRMLLVRKASDIESALATHRVGVTLALEGADPLGIDVDLIEVFYALGVRAVGLTWNNRNPFADGRLAGDPPGGLSALGLRLLTRMEELGILIDLAHLSPVAMEQVLSRTTKPVMLSHSRPQSGVVSATHLQEIGGKNGVIGVMLYGSKSIAEVIAQIEYLVSLVDDDHVGLGTDLWTAEDAPRDFPDIAHLPRLEDALSGLGWSDSAIRRVMGGNWHRLMAEVLR